jgi:hypothetical protein
VSTGLVVEVGQCQREIQDLHAEVAQQREGAHKLREQVNGETLVFLVAFPPGIRGWLSDAADVRLGQVKSRDLKKKLTGVKDTLQKKCDAHNTLCIAVRVVYGDLELALAQETSSLIVHVTRITERAHEIVRHALCFSVQQTFVTTRSHYENIDLAAMSQGFAPNYNDDELERIEETAAAPA